MQSFNISKKEMDAELAARKKLIERAGPDFEGFFKEAQDRLFCSGIKGGKKPTGTGGC
jgi:hypothetical protein